MKREISFRGKRLSDGEWIYDGSLLRSWDNELFAICLMDDINLPIDKVLVDPNTICQFTGLYDGDEHKIYEGDILERSADNRSRMIVLFNEHWNAFVMSKGLNTEPMQINQDYLTYNYYRVIGNIFDNPELMKGDVLL
jgi:uncharacterized phage protein (TIGR01671 family)